MQKLSQFFFLFFFILSLRYSSRTNESNKKVNSVICLYHDHNFFITTYHTFLHTPVPVYAFDFSHSEVAFFLPPASVCQYLRHRFGTFLLRLLSFFSFVCSFTLALVPNFATTRRSHQALSCCVLYFCFRGLWKNDGLIKIVVCLRVRHSREFSIDTETIVSCLEEPGATLTVKWRSCLK